MRDPDVQQPLMLVMPVAIERLDRLKATLRELPDGVLDAALDKVGTVHSSRFVILEDEDGAWARLIVIATFDGSLRDYIAAFARELNWAFNTLFAFVEDTEDKPSTPVERDVERFIRYVENRNVGTASGRRAYSAYPNLTALDIYEATRPVHDSAPALVR